MMNVDFKSFICRISYDCLEKACLCIFSKKKCFLSTSTLTSALFWVPGHWWSLSLGPILW